MFNTYAETNAIFEHELNEYKSVQVTRIVHDFYDADPKRGFYGGGGFDARIGPNPIAWALLAPPPGVRGAEFKSLLEAMPRAMMSRPRTSLPLETNRVDLDPELKDAWGLRPCASRTRTTDDLATGRFLQDRGVEVMQAAGAQQVWKGPLVESPGSPHLLGTCRMGNDPNTSVVDRYHRTHDIPNLFLCDGSSFVTSGRGQPTMTIQALAFRAADHIARFARSGEI
jgi:choline dehydrogenase-like flavoprotein